MYRIVRRQQFSDTTFLWDVHAPDVAKAAQPGHFVMVRLREGGERIPLTVADFELEIDQHYFSKPLHVTRDRAAA